MGKKSKGKEAQKDVKKNVPADLASQINVISKQVVEDHAKANEILEIFTASQNEDNKVVLKCCSALKDIFIHFITSTKFLDAKKVDSEKMSEQSKGKHKFQDGEEIFLSWLLIQHSVACDILYDHLDHESKRIQTCAFESLKGILEAEGKLKANGASSDSQKIVEAVIFRMITSEVDKKELIQELPHFLSAQGQEKDELAVFALQSLNKLMKKIGQSPSDKVLVNIWQLIRQISSSSSSQLGEKAKNLLTAVVCKFLRYKMPVKLYKDILTEISLVMAKMSSPLRLTDFLSESFSKGGAISLMCLNALFILMHQYNLDYPDFYGKLYSMFQPQVFGAKYRSRFFHLSDLFLSSTHLPAYLVAAFAKRLARLILHAPATFNQIAVPFILNLIKRHPAIEVLLHRAEGKTEFECDPFVEDASLTECHALESCFWELQTIEHHFDPSISTKAKKRTIRDEDLSIYLNRSAEDIVEMEAKKIKPNIPVTFEKCESLNLPCSFMI